MNTTASMPTTTPDRSGSLLWGVLGGTALVVLWAYWPSLTDMAQAWSHSSEYSHGYLVPVFAAFLLWLRRDRLATDDGRTSWWGLAFLAVAVGLRAYGTYQYRVWLEQISLLPCLAGLVLLLGGWTGWRWAWPSILFPFFMVPLPFSISRALSGPLQLLATECSTFILQTIGLPAVSEGTTIRINDAQIGIVEACSGLKMLVVFFALSTGMALVTRAPLFDRLVLVASSVPIALTSNIIRITITGLLHELANSEAANVFFHDVAGWFMMPLALGMLWLELKVLAKLLVESKHGTIAPPSRNRQRPSAPAGSRPKAGRAAPAPRSTRRPASESAALGAPEGPLPPEPLAPQGVPA